jgi:hypothetical protein
MLVMTAVLALAAGAGAAADCSKDAKNLLAKSDCGFATGIKGWDSGTLGKISHDAREGAPSPGALKVVGTEGTLEAKGPCLPAKPKTTYKYGGRMRLVSGETYVCGAQVHHYSDAACQESLGILSAMADLVKKEWQALDPARRPEAGPNQGVATMGAETKAMKLVLVCSGAPGFTVLFDDVWLNEP